MSSGDLPAVGYFAGYGNSNAAAAGSGVSAMQSAARPMRAQIIPWSSQKWQVDLL